MSIPSNAGIGTGAAQVYGQDKTYEALRDVAGRSVEIAEYKNKLAAQKKRDAEEANKQKKVDYTNFLKSMEYDSKGIRTADIPVAQEIRDKIVKSFSGKFEEIANGGKAKIDFDEAMGSLRTFVGQSLSTKEAERKELDTILKSTDYTQEDKDTAVKMSQTPALTYEKDWAGRFTPTLNLGDPIGDSVKNFDLDVFYKKPTSVETDNSVYTDKSKKLLPDEAGFSTWKDGVMRDVKLLQKINGVAKNHGVKEEDALRYGWNVFKANYLPESTDITNTTKEIKVDKPDFGYNSDKWNLDVTKNVDLGTNVLTFANKSTGKLIPISGGEVVDNTGKAHPLIGVVNKMWVGKDGTIKAVVSGNINDVMLNNEEVTLTENAFKQVKATTGIKETFDSFIKKQTPSSETGVGIKTQTQEPAKKEIKNSDIATKAKQAGYSEGEYKKLLIANGVKII